MIIFCIVVYIDGDGKMELAIGYSDRMIRVYKWHPALTTPPTAGTTCEPKGALIQFDRWQLAGQVLLFITRLRL